MYMSSLYELNIVNSRTFIHSDIIHSLRHRLDQSSSSRSHHVLAEIEKKGYQHHVS